MMYYEYIQGAMFVLLFYCFVVVTFYGINEKNSFCYAYRHVVFTGSARINVVN